MVNLIEAIKLLEREALKLDRDLMARSYNGDLRITNEETRENIMSHMKSYRKAVQILRSKDDTSER